MRLRSTSAARSPNGGRVDRSTGATPRSTNPQLARSSSAARPSGASAMVVVDVAVEAVVTTDGSGPSCSGVAPMTGSAVGDDGLPGRANVDAVVNALSGLVNGGVASSESADPHAAATTSHTTVDHKLRGAKCGRIGAARRRGSAFSTGRCRSILVAHLASTSRSTGKYMMPPFQGSVRMNHDAGARRGWVGPRALDLRQAPRAAPGDSSTARPRLVVDYKRHLDSLDAPGCVDRLAKRVAGHDDRSRAMPWRLIQGRCTVPSSVGFGDGRGRFLWFRVDDRTYVR